MICFKPENINFTEMIGFEHNSYTYLVTLFSKTDLHCNIVDVQHKIGKEELN